VELIARPLSHHGDIGRRKSGVDHRAGSRCSGHERRDIIAGAVANDVKELPPFPSHATTSGFLADSEIDRLIADHQSLLAEAKLGAGTMDPTIRRSQVVFLGTEEKYRWLYERVWAAARECNRQFFAVDIATVEANIQLARYDSGDLGHYNWHTDFAGFRPLRKISISIQLSRPEDYEGGDLELLFGNSPLQLDKTRGTFIAFPSFMLHRVTPVTRGTRWSLVAWILGTRWR
jgi:predicted 2-oxoglutarate/Fe(II)-dependent dioxygenase YbiX